MSTLTVPLPVHGDLAEIDPASPWCQRWSARRQSWARAGDGGFDAASYMVEPIDEAVAKDYVVANHYSGTYPAASRRYGLRYADGALVGVAVFGIPAQAAVLTNVFPDLAPYRESLELSRFVLESSRRAPANAESWFLARCFEHLADDGVRGVVSFSDPVPRVVDGRVLFGGHVGTIYQASNAAFTGRGTARTITVLRDGTTLSDRAIQKVRRTERGHEYVERRLVGLGARAPRAGEAGTAWLTSALDDVRAVRLRHRGCLRYAFTTSHRDRRQVRIAPPRLPYPKAVDEPS